MFEFHVSTLYSMYVCVYIATVLCHNIISNLLIKVSRPFMFDIDKYTTRNFDYFA